MDYTFDDLKDDYSEEEDYIDGEGELSFAHTLSRACAGDGEYQYLLGFVYFNSGYGVKRDVKKARYWYEKSAENGNMQGQCALADILNARQKYDEAFELYLKAARQGHYYAMTRVGVAYYKGLGVDKNVTEAKLWLLQGSKGGYGEAYYYLAQCFKGEDEKQYLSALIEASGFNYEDAYFELAMHYISKGDFETAYGLYDTAAKRGSERAKRFLNGG